MEGLTRYVMGGDEAVTQRFDWGQLTWLDGAEVNGNEALTVAMVHIHAGQKNPRHYHPNCDEALVLLQGRLRHWVGDEVFELNPGDTIHIPMGAWHNAESVGWEPARMLVCYNSGRRETVFER